MQPVYLLCGPPGSGKTWVGTQLEHKFTYVKHDAYDWKDNNQHFKATLDAAKESEKPVLTDIPFGERDFKERLENKGLTVIPVFVLEHATVVQKRYEAREKKKIPKHFLSRTLSIPERAKEWKAFVGTSEQVLAHMKDVEFNPHLHGLEQK